MLISDADMQDLQKKGYRFAGVINYGRNSSPQQTVFQNFNTKCANHLYDSSECRRVKLIGIKGIKNIKERVLEVIWKNL